MSRKAPWVGLAVLVLCGLLVRAAAETPEQGRTVYADKCAVCHGENGDGAGIAADRLHPRPRNFTRGEYRLASTWEGVATDRDLFLTISRGMPGTSMPPWDDLPEQTRWALVDYVKSFSRRPLNLAPKGQPPELGEPGTGEIVLPPRPEASQESRARARLLYGEACAPCHGATGRGDGKLPQRDSAGRPTSPRDLTLGIFKGGGTPEEIYKRVVLGLPGSPMPSNPFFHGDDGWALVEMILSFSGEGRHPGAAPATRQVIARAMSELPVDPSAAAWSGIESFELSLMPLRSKPGPPPVIEVAAGHLAGRLALALAWSGAPAASVEFSAETVPAYRVVETDGVPPARWLWSETATEASPRNGNSRGSCDETGCRVVFSGVPEAGAGGRLKVSFALWNGEPLQQVALSVWTELSIQPGS